ncbi:hypothetical protein IWQ60_005909 [Tieghemiomyces parasiticus]|uniref:Uncharacterized protein n=1 Tax=Tieghemiomyces parasiticus TaxID=78921 RepID=A0A9W8A5B4_9FUNG|nr:hypothetical protein IWQ60_005909 [Tieghemiomyces parasiticus]
MRIPSPATHINRAELKSYHRVRIPTSSDLPPLERLVPPPPSVTMVGLPASHGASNNNHDLESEPAGTHCNHLWCHAYLRWKQVQLAAGLPEAGVTPPPQFSAEALAAIVRCQLEQNQQLRQTLDQTTR